MDKDSTEKPISKSRAAELRRIERDRIKREDDAKEQPSWLADGAVKWPPHDGRWWFPVRWRPSWRSSYKCPACEAFPERTAFYGFSYDNDPGWSRAFLWAFIDGQTNMLQSFQCLECGLKWIRPYHNYSGVDDAREMQGFRPEPTLPPPPKPPRVPKTRSEDRPVGPKLRFQILQRDSFRCAYCGQRASEAVQLEVDHIHPRAKGGKTVEENLITACQPCNIGKRDRVLEVQP